MTTGSIKAHSREPANRRTAPIRVGLLGFGVVGSGVYRMLHDNREAIVRRVGVAMEIVKIGVRDANKQRIVHEALLTTNLESIVDDPEIEVVVELMGGLSPAGELIERALRNGKHVVTANKELVAKQGTALVRYAYRRGLDMHFEAAVGGGIPLIQPLKHQLAGNDVIRMMGILNGTTNYILTQMTEAAADFDEVLAEAQAQGFAEADPTSDVDGYDAQYKLAILASIAFGGEVQLDGVYREGIRAVTQKDIGFADVLGYRIKLLAIVESTGPDAILARVHPALVPKSHPLATVSGVYNALWFQGDFVGDVMFSGRGAGSDPTASAVVGDLVDIGRNVVNEGSGSAIPVEGAIATEPIERLMSAYYVRLIVQDRPKVLGGIATTFGSQDVSLAAMEMRTLEGGMGEIVFLTHRCLESSFRRALEEIERLETIHNVANWLRVVAE
jgi:homoserine dehydrogenase